MTLSIASGIIKSSQVKNFTYSPFVFITHLLQFAIIPVFIVTIISSVLINLSSFTSVELLQISTVSLVEQSSLVIGEDHLLSFQNLFTKEL